MKFVITDPNHGFGDVCSFQWELQKKDGTPVCRSVDREDGWGFPTEAETRSDIAQAKVSMKAARFAKVEVAS